MSGGGRIRSKAWSWGRAVNSGPSPFSAIQKHVLKTIEQYMSPAGDSCFPAMETLAEDCSHSVSSVRDAIKVASEWGWLDREIRRGRGRTNRYLAVIPEYFDQEATADENHRRAAVFAGLTEKGPVLQGLSTSETEKRLTPAVFSEGEKRRAESVKPPEGISKTAGDRHQLDQDLSKDHPTLTPSELGAQEEERVDRANALGLALTVELGASGTMTRVARELWLDTIEQLVDVDATVEEVQARCKAYRRIFPTAQLTPHALVKHWPQLGTTEIRSSAGPDQDAKLEAWVMKTGCRLEPEHARDLLAESGIAADKIEQALSRAAVLREQHAAAAAATRAAIDEARAAA